jgi:hypothetical protein
MSTPPRTPPSTSRRARADYDSARSAQPTRRGDAASSSLERARKSPLPLSASQGRGAAPPGNPVAAQVVEELTPVMRRNKRNQNIARKEARAAARLQAVYRGKKARKTRTRKGHAATSVRECSGRLEPPLTMACALIVGLQWDQAVVYQIGDSIHTPGLVAANAGATTLYASILTLVLMTVHDGYNRRALALVKQALQVLVGYMWSSCIELADVNIGELHLTHLTQPNVMWARFGIVTGALHWVLQHSPTPTHPHPRALRQALTHCQTQPCTHPTLPSHSHAHTPPARPKSAGALRTPLPRDQPSTGSATKGGRCNRRPFGALWAGCAHPFGWTLHDAIPSA